MTYRTELVRVAFTGHHIDDHEWTINGPGITIHETRAILGRFPSQAQVAYLERALNSAYSQGERSRSRDFLSLLGVQIRSGEVQPK